MGILFIAITTCGNSQFYSFVSGLYQAKHLPFIDKIEG